MEKSAGMETLAVQARGLEVRYGSIVALRGVDLSVSAGQVTAVIGPNGAGKTSLIRGLSGVVRPSAGSVAFYGRDVSRKRTFTRARLGMIEVPEGRGILGHLTVRENLWLGLDWLAGPVRKRREAIVHQILTDERILGERADAPASSLSGGEQQLLGFTRARMMAESTPAHCLLLDEPSLGLAPRIVAAVFAQIAALKDAGGTMLLVEQDVAHALAVADRVLLLEGGSIAADGPPEVIATDERVVEAYLPPSVQTRTGSAMKEGAMP